MQDERNAHAKTQGNHEETMQRCDELDKAHAELATQLQEAHDAADKQRSEHSAALRRAGDQQRAESAALQDGLRQAEARCSTAEASVSALEVEAAALRSDLQLRAMQLEKLRQQAERAWTVAGDVRRQERAAVTIQRCYRHWQRRQADTAAYNDAQGWRAEMAVLDRQQRRAAAQTGRALVSASIQQMEATMQTLLLEMLLSGPVKRKLKAAQQSVRVHGAAPQLNGSGSRMKSGLLTPPASKAMPELGSTSSSRVGTTPRII